MIASWMLHLVVSTAVLALAALVLERGLRGFRLATRGVWVVSLASMAALTTWRFFPRSAISDPSPIAPSSSGPATITSVIDWTTTTPLAVTVDVPSVMLALDAPLLIAWGLASAAGSLFLLAGAWRLRRARRSWERDEVDGSPVYVSHDVGPAVVGMWRHSLVIPRWVLELPARDRALVLAHEREHARASDPVHLLIGALVLVAVPWNPVVWWSFFRLRLAIEVDCDRRVMAKGTDARDYGNLLISVAERVMGGVAPLPTLAESRSVLEQRLRLLARERRRSPARLVAMLTTSVLCAIMACSIPRPRAAITPASFTQADLDVLEYRWVRETADPSARRYAAPGSGEPLALGDTVALDVAGVERARVWRQHSVAGVSLQLNPHGATRFGASTATHIGSRIAVLLDDRVITVATVNSRLGPTIPFADNLSGEAAERVVNRINGVVAKLRPLYPLTITR